MQTESHFGLDTVTNIDSVVIKRPNGKKQVLLNITTNQTIKANIKDATGVWAYGCMDEDNCLQKGSNEKFIPVRHHQYSQSSISGLEMFWQSFEP